jgi:hypothetical protein
LGRGGVASRHFKLRQAFGAFAPLADELLFHVQRIAAVRTTYQDGHRTLLRRRQGNQEISRETGSQYTPANRWSHRFSSGYALPFAAT